MHACASMEKVHACASTEPGHDHASTDVEKVLALALGEGARVVAMMLTTMTVIVWRWCGRQG